MIVNCEECGKKYQVDPSKIRGRYAEATCTSCNSKIRINNTVTALNNFETPTNTVPVPQNATKKFEKQRSRKKKLAAASKSKRYAMGLRTKMLLLFFLIPIVLIISAGYLFLDQLNKLSSIISDENSKVVTDIAETIISQKAYSVANQVKLYLDTHPDLKPEDFPNDPEFMKVAVQKVGEKGYTVLNIAPDGTKPWTIGAHPNPKLIGAAVIEKIKEKLSHEDYIIFKKLHDNAIKNGKISTGYYRFLDDKEKYQAMVPVPGTNYWTISTTYIDEFTEPMVKLQEKASDITNSTQHIVLLIISVTAVLVALIAIVYGNRLSGKIRKMKDIADSISVGDMNIEIDISDKDELGDLAQAISRMQDSIRLSIERLRRRRRAA